VKSVRGWVMLLIMAMLVSVASGCGGQSPAPAEEPEPGEEEAKEPIVIKIGSVGPLTGDFAAGGYSQVNGARLAVKEINAMEQESGGNIRIELLEEDDASVPDQAVNATVKLITRENVHAIIGAFNSPCTLAVVPVCARYEVPQFTVSGGLGVTTQGSDWVFRINAGTPAQGKAIANFAVEGLGHEKIAIGYVHDDYGLSSAEAVRDELKKQFNIDVVMMDTWTRGDKDYSGLISKIKQSGATAVFLTGSFADCALIAKQIKEFNLDVQILGDSGMASPQYWNLAEEAAEGSVVVEPFSVADPDPKIQNFVKTFREAYGNDPDGWSAAVYDAVHVIYEAVKQAGKADRQVIRDYTRALNAEKPYKGIIKAMYFDETGESMFPLYNLEWTQGEKVILKAPE